MCAPQDFLGHGKGPEPMMIKHVESYTQIAQQITLLEKNSTEWYVLLGYGARESFLKMSFEMGFKNVKNLNDGEKRKRILGKDDL